VQLANISKLGKRFSITRYLKETRSELRKVTWPTRDEAIKLTIVVIVTIIVMATLLGVIDYLFSVIFDLVI